jgi:putative transposase
MPKRPRRPSAKQKWRTFLKNHLPSTAAIDFFTIPTATFRVLYGFVVLDLARRLIVHTNVTANPTAEWTALQIVQAFPYDTAPIRDRDAIYGAAFRRRLRGMGIQEVVTPARCPIANPYAERVVGTLRRECFDHLIVLGEHHARRILREYVGYYNRSRTHLSLGKDAPVPRPVQPREAGTVVALPVLGGLHHRYDRRAA